MRHLTPCTLRRVCSCVGLAFICAPAFAADVAPQEETVKLSAFEVTGASVGPYQVADSTGGSRVRVNLFEATQSIYVVTPELMADLGAKSPLESLKYFPGITRGTEPEGSGAERMTFRGYQITTAVIDGVDVASGGNFNRNQTSAFVERIEVVMGTDSVLSPSGIPGGTMNMVTKKPRYANFGSAKLFLGKHNTNEAQLDVNRMLSKSVAVRLVTSGVRGDAYGSGFQHGFGYMGEGSYRFRNGSTVTLQFRYSWGNQQNGAQVGIPLDPSVGTTGYAIPLAGLERDAGERLYKETNLITNLRSWNLFYNAQLTDHLATRLVIRAEGWTQQQRTPTLVPVQGLGGAYNPLTGQWVPGFTFGGAPNFTPTAVARPNGMYNANISFSSNHTTNYNLQDDWVLNLELGPVRSQTLAGVAGNLTRSVGRSYADTITPFNIFTDSMPKPTPGVLASWSSAKNNYVNLYVNEVAKMLENDRVVMNVGFAKNWNNLHTDSNSFAVGYESHPSPLFFNYGAVVKALPNVALYFGHSESATPQNSVPTTVPYVDRTSAKQDEAGIRMKFLNGKAMATATYYEIKQNNFQVLNPLNFSIPAPVPPFPQLLLNRVARGWEYQVNATVTPELSALVSYTNFRNRDPNGIPIRGTAENAFAAWVHYDKNKGAFKGLGIGLGYTHTGKVVGDTATGLSAASTTGRPIPNQPRFYVPTNGIYNVTVSYKRGPWVIRGFVDNALDVEYIGSSLSRTGVFPGTPINPRLHVEYSF